MSVKSKHSSKKDSGAVKEKKKKLEDSDEDIESSEEELDLTKECHPIGYYMNDRTEMINQMFSVIKGNKLKAMLPPVLKECDIEQLKLQCLDQLLGMSEKRITCILEGEVLETSSESEIAETDQYDSDEKNGTSSVSSSNRSNDSREEGIANNVGMKHKKRKKEFSGESKPGKISKTESGPVEQGKTLLEILELEMRARAIRALLKQSGNEKGGEQVADESKTEINGVKDLSGEIVDLTECEDEEVLGNTKKDLGQEEEIDKKVSSFEEKIEKSQTEKANAQEDEKSKRLQAELELRNKLFKKKIYRTRQQRMENEEEEKSSEKCSGEETNAVEVAEVVVKQEPVEPEEIVLEDPEEGELSTSEDECPVEIKQEPQELAEPVDGPVENDFETKMDEDAERVTAIDNGTFVPSRNLESVAVNSQDNAEDGVEETRNDKSSIRVGGQSPRQEVGSQGSVAQESEPAVEETSWRDRWLQKDGVQKLVKSSKIYAKVKKRIAEKSQRAREDVPTAYEANSDSNSNSKLEMIEGSIEEYERLLGKSLGQKDEGFSKGGNVNQCGSESASETPENIMGGSLR